MRKREAIQPVVPVKNFIIEKKVKEHDEEEIEREIQNQLQARRGARNTNESRHKEHAPVSAQPNSTICLSNTIRLIFYCSYAPQVVEYSPDYEENKSSNKKVVKKRIVKMMKDGKLVAEKEEILDEEGNVLRTEIRKEGSLKDNEEISG